MAYLKPLKRGYRLYTLCTISDDEVFETLQLCYIQLWGLLAD